MVKGLQGEDEEEEEDEEWLRFVQPREEQTEVVL